METATAAAQKTVTDARRKHTQPSPANGRVTTHTAVRAECMNNSGVAGASEGLAPPTRSTGRGIFEGRNGGGVSVAGHCSPRHGGDRLVPGGIMTVLITCTAPLVAAVCWPSNAMFLSQVASAKPRVRVPASPYTHQHDRSGVHARSGGSDDDDTIRKRLPMASNVHALRPCDRNTAMPTMGTGTLGQKKYAHRQ